MNIGLTASYPCFLPYPENEEDNSSNNSQYRRSEHDFSVVDAEPFPACSLPLAWVRDTDAVSLNERINPHHVTVSVNVLRSPFVHEDGISLLLGIDGIMHVDGIPERHAVRPIHIFSMVFGYGHILRPTAA